VSVSLQDGRSSCQAELIRRVTFRDAIGRIFPTLWGEIRTIAEEEQRTAVAGGGSAATRREMHQRRRRYAASKGKLGKTREKNPTKKKAQVLTPSCRWNRKKWIAPAHHWLAAISGGMERGNRRQERRCAVLHPEQLWGIALWRRDGEDSRERGGESRGPASISAGTDRRSARADSCRSKNCFESAAQVGRAHPEGRGAPEGGE